MAFKALRSTHAVESRGLPVASFVDGLFDREGIVESGQRRSLALLVDDQDRRCLIDLHGASDRPDQATWLAGASFTAILLVNSTPVAFTRRATTGFLESLRRP